jgi:hypothetical protein
MPLLSRGHRRPRVGGPGGGRYRDGHQRPQDWHGCHHFLCQGCLIGGMLLLSRQRCVKAARPTPRWRGAPLLRPARVGLRVLVLERNEHFGGAPVFADALVCGSCRMKVWQDLFGCVLLARPLGRIGTEGRVSLDPHHDASTARNVLARQKRRRCSQGSLACMQSAPRPSPHRACFARRRCLRPGRSANPDTHIPTRWLGEPTRRR